MGLTSDYESGGREFESLRARHFSLRCIDQPNANLAIVDARDCSHFRSLAASAAAAHVAMPCAINCANSSGEPSSGSKPDPASLPATSSDLSAAWAAAESFSITAGGVPAGGIRPNQTVQSKLGRQGSGDGGMVGRNP